MHWRANLLSHHAAQPLSLSPLLAPFLFASVVVSFDTSRGNADDCADDSRAERADAPVAFASACSHSHDCRADIDADAEEIDLVDADNTASLFPPSPTSP